LYIKNISESKNRPNSQQTEKRNLIDDAMNEPSVGSDKAMSMQGRKAVEFLSTSNSYDMNQALIICQLHNFKVCFLSSKVSKKIA
jgi:hypothetical protein